MRHTYVRHLWDVQHSPMHAALHCIYYVCVLLCVHMYMYTFDVFWVWVCDDAIMYYAVFTCKCMCDVLILIRVEHLIVTVVWKVTRRLGKYL